METDYSRVSLGFAEFVSQLIHETFDAILDSQNYQIEKYLGLEKALNTSDVSFASKYLSASEINEFIISELGFELKPNMVLDAQQTAVIAGMLAPTGTKELIKSKLSKVQYDAVYNALVSKLVEDKKAKIRMFVERPELARLMVDSGEIRAKLDLFCLNETSASSVTGPAKMTKIAKPAKEVAPVVGKTAFEVKALDFSSLQLSGISSAIKATEILDKESGLKTILIDKSSLLSKDVNLNIPTARIVANPINSSSSSSISSEVTIKFRSI